MAKQRIIVRDVSKIFGPHQAPALALLEAGEGKDGILAQTNSVVGLNRVSFHVSEGEILVVMGLSGSGKSTMLRCINRLVEPTLGSIIVDGTEVTSLSSKELLEFRRTKFGMVFQHFALFPNRTILENTEYGLEIQKVPKNKRVEKAMDALEIVGLKGWEAKYPNQLSGGMQQRAGLARALAANADILLMDEAFGALDPLIRRDMQQELRQLQRNLAKTIVFVSHDLDEAISLGGRIILMKDGEIVQMGWPEEILMQPATEYVQRFVEHIDVSAVLTVERLANRAVPVLYAQQTIADARTMIVGSDAGTWFVVDESRRLVGRLTQEALASAPSSHAVAQAMENEVARIHAATTLKTALPALVLERYCLPVVADGDQLIGSLTSRGAVAALAGITPAREPSGASDDGGKTWIGQSQSFHSTNSATKLSPGLPLTALP